MADFFAVHWGTLLTGALVLAVVTLVVLKMAKDRKKGKKSCGCDCGSCSAAAGCHSAAARAPKDGSARNRP